MIVEKLLAIYCFSQTLKQHWNNQKTSTQVRSLLQKVSCAIINTPLDSLSTCRIRSVCLLCPEIAHSVYVYVSILIWGGFSSGWPQREWFIFQDLYLRPPVLLKSVIFAHIVPQGDQISVGSRRGQCIASAPAPFSIIPSGPQQPLPPIFFTTATHELMIFRLLAFGSVVPRWEGTLSPCSSVPIKCPLQLEMPQIKGSSWKAG